MKYKKLRPTKALVYHWQVNEPPEPILFISFRNKKKSRESWVDRVKSKTIFYVKLVGQTPDVVVRFVTACVGANFYSFKVPFLIRSVEVNNERIIIRGTLVYPSVESLMIQPCT